MIKNFRISRKKDIVFFSVSLLKRLWNFKKDEQLAIFSPEIESDNLGDSIIQIYCDEIINSLNFSKNKCKFPTHVLPSNDQIRYIKKSKYKIVCGSNLMTPHFEKYTNWKMPKYLDGYNDIVTMGVGWGYYDKTISQTSKNIYNLV